MTSDDDFLEGSRFWIQRVLVPVVVCIGIGGNIVTVMVLTRKRMRCSTNIYLTALAVTDLIYLLFVFFLSLKHYPNANDGKYHLYWRFFGVMHWFTDAASSTSIWLTVSFTVERYIAVCHPIKGKVLCTEQRAKRVIAVISIICILSTISTAFEYQLKTANETCVKQCNNTEPDDVSAIIRLEITITNVSYNNFIAKNENLLQKNSNTPWHVISDQSEFQNKFAENNTDLAIKIVNNNNEVEKILFPLINITTTANMTWSISIIKSLQKRHSPTPDTVVPTNEDIQQLQNISFDNDTLENENFSLSSSSLNSTNINDSFLGCCEEKTYKILTEGTNLANSEIYQTVFYWFSSIMFNYLPLILIATFNCFLVHTVHRSQINRKKLTNSQENNTQVQENRITIILIGVVVLFLVCQTPAALMLSYTAIKKDDKGEENIRKALGNIFNFLTLMHSACNFILYCVLSDKYRRTFKMLLCGRSLNREDTSVHSSRASTRLMSQRQSTLKNGVKRNTLSSASKNYEMQSLNSIPRARSTSERSGKGKENTIV